MTRTIHIYCDGGFGNRFNGLISGMLLAQAAGLQPVVVWPVNNWCGARYDEVIETPAQVIERELVTYVPKQGQFHFLMTEDHLGMGVPNRSCLAMSSMEEAVDYIRQSPLPVFFHTPLIPPWMEKELVLRAVGSLQFKAELVAAADAFIAEQGLQDFFGIQIRKTDFGTRGADEEGLFNLVAQLPHKRFFVCSDAKAVEQRFAALSHVAVYPKQAHVEMLVQGDWNTATTDSSGRLYACNVNRSAQSVRDAVVDILLLSRSQVVRTTNSTFLNTAILIREANLAQASTPRTHSDASGAPLSFVVSNPGLNFISRLHVTLPQTQIFDVHVQVTREYPARGWEPCLFEVTIEPQGCVIRFDRPSNWHHFKIDLHHGGIGTPEVSIERDTRRSDADIASLLRQRHIVFLGCARQCGSRLGETLTKLRELGSLFASYEVLVFENDSTDDTRAVLQQWVQHMPIRLICEDGLDAHLPTRTQRLAYARNRLLSLAKAENCDYVCWADMDGVVNALHPSIESFCSNFAHEAVWDAVFPVNTGPYYDIWAFRQRQVCPGDYGARINAVDAAFGKPLAFHFGLNHLQTDFRLMAGWLPVESAFGGMALYKRSVLDFAHYEGMRDDVETCEHVTFNQGLAAKGCNLYINPDFRVDTHGTWPALNSSEEGMAMNHQNPYTIERFDEVKINQGTILSTLNENKRTKNLKDYEFKVFSQWGEDGIIQHLTKSIEIKNKTFIEFGVEDFQESNCRFLLMKDNWSGFVIDGSKSNIQKLRNSYFYWKYNLQAVDNFITKENIEDILESSGFERELGILSVDLDGNDFFILESIRNFNPSILICEYNAVFGASRKITIPYQADFYRTNAHHSNLYFGASLAAMTHLANEKGYSLVGTNTAGVNAFYVRNDLLNDKVQVLSVEAAYSPSKFRESRDESGKLTFMTGDARLEAIKGLPVYEVEKKIIENL